jgi:hypothetical protein
MALSYNDTAGLLQIRVDHSEIDRLIHGVLSPAALKRVQTRAINETTAWLKGRLLKDLPSATGIPRKVLSRRIRQGKAKAQLGGGISGKVWLGVKPIDAMALKDGGPVGTGYEAGGFYFEGGFKAFYKIHTGSMGLFARKGGGRLPIKRQNVRIDHFVNEAVRRLLRPAEHQLAQKMHRLVSFELERATR